jgi:hypothetical protein
MTMATMGAANIIIIGKMVADPYRNSFLTSAQMNIAWQFAGAGVRAQLLFCPADKQHALEHVCEAFWPWRKIMTGIRLAHLYP